MTVTTTDNNVVYRGNGATTEFPVPFKVLDKDDLVVKRRLFTTGLDEYTYVGTDYDFTGIGDDSGTLTLAGTALADTYELVIERIVAYTQDLDIVNAGGFYPETVEDQLDRMVMGMQQLSDQVDRSSLVPVGENGFTLSRASARANKFWAFDALGNFVASSGTGADAGLREDMADPTIGASLVATAMLGLAGATSESDLRTLVEGDGEYSVLNKIPRAIWLDILAGTVVDVSTYVQSALDAAMELGRVLTFPIGTFQIDDTILVRSSNYMEAPLSSFAPGPKIRGAGSGLTILKPKMANAAMFDFDTDDDHTVNFKALLGVSIRDLSIVGDDAVAGTTAIKLRTVAFAQISDLHISGFGGSGIQFVCLNGDLDSSGLISIERCRIQSCDVFGIDSAAAVGHNEISTLRIIQTQVEDCGTFEGKAITGITRANPGVVTCVGHGFSDGQSIRLAAINGMVEANDQRVTVTVINANSFSIGINTSAYTAWTDGGYAFPAEPSSGGIRWKGQVLSLQDTSCTICQNCSLYIKGEAGLGQDVTLLNFVSENPSLVGVLVTGVLNMDWDRGQLYTNDTFSGHGFHGLLLDGSTSALSNVQVNEVTVRATAADLHYCAFLGMGGNFESQNCRVRNTSWKSFDHNAGQRRIVGFEFDPIPVQGRLSVVDANTVNVKPYGEGNLVPMRKAGPIGGAVRSVTGEWVPMPLTNAGISKVGISGLAATTIYYVYSYDNANVHALEVSLTGPVMGAHGYKVKDGDETRYYWGRVITTGGGDLETAGIGWLNAKYDPGFGYMWWSGAGALRRSATEPASDGDGAPV